MIFCPLVLQLSETVGICISLLNLYVIKLTECSISIFHICNYAQSLEKINPYRVFFPQPSVLQQFQNAPFCFHVHLNPAAKKKKEKRKKNRKKKCLAFTSVSMWQSCFR